MIEVQGLSKTFAGGVVALRDVDFAARPGEVLGFLGPNGAGKTTTMRILSGYLLPTQGRAAICGLDVTADSLEVRRRVGYLPEQVPLYGEMRVREYLHYRARLKGVARSGRRRQVEEAMEQVGLSDHGDQVIERLSKGYRQRVGLADALLHAPQVLILDEPTDGLDPNQRRQILGLIGALGKERTVVLSTHVLPEVETVCQQVVIVDRGQVVARGSPAELVGQMVEEGAVDLRCRGDGERLRVALAACAGVEAVETQPAGPAAPAVKDVHRFRVRLSRAWLAAGSTEAGNAERAGAACEALARAALSAGELQSLTPAHSSLEAVFRWVTQRPGAHPEAGADDDANRKPAP